MSIIAPNSIAAIREVRDRLLHATASILQDQVTTAHDGAELTLNGTAGVVLMDVVITGTATVRPEIAAMAGAPWRRVRSVNTFTGETVLDITESGSYVVSAAAAERLRARVSTISSGTVSVRARSGVGSIDPYVISRLVPDVGVVLQDSSTIGGGAELQLDGTAGTVLIDVHITGTARVRPEIIPMTGAAWRRAYGVNTFTGESAREITESGGYLVNTAGAGVMRVRIHTIESGTVRVNARPGVGAVDPYVLARLEAIDSKLETSMRMQNRVARRHGVLAASTNELLLSVSKSCWIERFEVIMNHVEGGARIVQDHIGWEMLRTTGPGNVTENALTYANVRDFGDAQFETTYEDTGLYKMGLRDRIFVAAGTEPIDFWVINRASSDINLRAYLRVTEVL